MLGVETQFIQDENMEYCSILFHGGKEIGGFSRAKQFQ